MRTFQQLEPQDTRGCHPPGRQQCCWSRWPGGQGCQLQKGRTLAGGRWLGIPQPPPESPGHLVGWPHPPTPPDLASRETRRVAPGRAGSGVYGPQPWWSRGSGSGLGQVGKWSRETWERGGAAGWPEGPTGRGGPTRGAGAAPPSSLAQRLTAGLGSSQEPASSLGCQEKPHTPSAPSSCPCPL